MARGDDITDTVTLTRADLADVVHRAHRLSRASPPISSERTLHHICGALSNGENVKLSGFGSFLLRDKVNAWTEPDAGRRSAASRRVAFCLPRQPDHARRGLRPQ
jgi:nucleoid DNA-binding protein